MVFTGMVITAVQTVPQPLQPRQKALQQNSPEYTVLLLFSKGPERNKVGGVRASQNAMRHHCVVSLSSAHLRESKKREAIRR